jgi:hypothetical protein
LQAGHSQQLFRCRLPHDTYVKRFGLLYELWILVGEMLLFTGVYFGVAGNWR